MNLIRDHSNQSWLSANKKIDPNTLLSLKTKKTILNLDRLRKLQYLLLFLGLLNYIDANELNASELDAETHDELDLIFAGKGSEVVSGVATYSGVNEEHTRHEMNFILKEAIRVIKEINANNSVPPHQFTVIQKANAILYLPASIHAGLLLGNANMDDSTTKMEGPISSVLHNIEKRFM